MSVISGCEEVQGIGLAESKTLSTGDLCASHWTSV